MSHKFSSELENEHGGGGVKKGKWIENQGGGDFFFISFFWKFCSWEKKASGKCGSGKMLKKGARKKK